MQTVDSLRVLTLNCWGLPDVVTKTVYRKYKDPAISKGRVWPKRTERFEAIANKLHNYDIVCLQEVWIKEDQNLLCKICKENGLPYSHIFSSGLLGSSGLQIISRFPIKEVFFHRYRVNGKIYRLDHGDYHAGKGFGYAKIAVSDTQTISVVVTHTIAKYNHEDDTYAADRLSQVWELIRFLQLTSRPNQPIIVVGDMNSRPNSVEYSLFTEVGKLVDAYGEHASRTNREHVIDEQSITSMDENPQRIDYIFFSKCQNWSLENARVVYNDKDFIYSDHFGVCATFNYNSGMSLIPRRKDSFSSVMNTFASDHKADVGMLPYEKERTINYKQEKRLLDECYQMVIKGIERAQWRKTTHFMRSITALMLVWLLLTFGVPIQVVISLVVYAVFEALVATFPVENEISALREVTSEIKYWI